MPNLILLIEDTLTDELLARKALEHSGVTHELVVVRDGQQASDWLFGEGEFASRDASKQPELILSDFKLPKFDAPEIIRRVRADARTRHIPFVVMSSSTELADRDASVREGADAYVSKPIRFSGFVEVIQQHVTSLLSQRSEP